MKCIRTFKCFTCPRASQLNVLLRVSGPMWMSSPIIWNLACWSWPFLSMAKMIETNRFQIANLISFSIYIMMQKYTVIINIDMQKQCFSPFKMLKISYTLLWDTFWVVNTFHSPGPFGVTNKNRKVYKDTTNTSYIWGYYHTTTNYTIYVCRGTTATVYFICKSRTKKTLYNNQLKIKANE